MPVWRRLFGYVKQVKYNTAIDYFGLGLDSSFSLSFSLESNNFLHKKIQILQQHFQVNGRGV